MILEVALPDSTLSEASDLREKTIKAGRIARALAVFRVDRVLIYTTDKHQYSKDRDLLLLLLRYIDTPQYLRRAVFPMTPALKYVGLLPPLRTRGHPLESSVNGLREGDIRWGIMTRRQVVDIGVDHLVRYLGDVSSRVPTLFKVIKTSPNIKVEKIDRECVNEYIGFDVYGIKDLVQYLRKSNNILSVVFSRNGAPFDRIERDIRASIGDKRSVLAIFGGPRRGVMEIFDRQRTEIKRYVDYWINTIPNQGTETVRLDEALFISLGLLNITVSREMFRKGYYSD